MTDFRQQLQLRLLDLERAARRIQSYPLCRLLPQTSTAGQELKCTAGQEHEIWYVPPLGTKVYNRLGTKAYSRPETKLYSWQESKVYSRPVTKLTSSFNSLAKDLNCTATTVHLVKVETKPYTVQLGVSSSPLHPFSVGQELYTYSKL